ncbi:recombination protein NinB [Achromobacter deleyi]|uniref:Recombination protein NinB n=1 Tax=Achromobacter deleyi TaxID=1353891 RepID=A0A7T4E774_9BURK|nr:recombination protein NinB [Achromobacter deleyi]QQB37969.1 recombination protein NinB [Achromobacter deleyi]
MRYPLNSRTRQRAHRDIDASPDGYFFAPPVEPSATLATKRKMWAMLGDIARQKLWPVNGTPRRLEDKQWKDIFTAALAKETLLAEGLYGGEVMLGEHTSDMSQRKMGDLIELMYAWGANNGVVWTEKFEPPGWVR